MCEGRGIIWRLFRSPTRCLAPSNPHSFRSALPTTMLCRPELFSIDFFLMVLVGLWVQSEPTQLAFNEQKTDDSSVETVSVRPLALSFPFPLSLFLLKTFRSNGPKWISGWMKSFFVVLCVRQIWRLRIVLWVCAGESGREEYLHVLAARPRQPYRARFHGTQNPPHFPFAQMLGWFFFAQTS